MKKMSITMEQAAHGHKKSMITLYEENKEKLYALCNILLSDEEKAALTATNIFNEVWGELQEKGITTEEKFRQYLFTSAAKQCRPASGEKTVKLDKEAIKQLSKGNQVYSGDVKKGMEQLHKALNSMDPYFRYVYLLAVAGNLDFKEIGQIIRQKDVVAKSHYDMAVVTLAEALAGSDLKVEYVKSLIGQGVKENKVPKTMDTACLEKIKACAYKPLQDKKILIPLICAIVVSIAVTALGIGTYMADYSEIKAQKQLEAKAEELGVDLLVKDATYFADIMIEDYGKIRIELDQESAPLTAANFAQLAVDGFYDGLTFHRIMDGFMMQGGDPEGNGTGGSDTTIPGEFSANGFENNLSHTRGTVSMARSDEFDSASSQFFIMQEDNTGLDGQYAAFGHVVEGMDIVDKICKDAKPTDNNGTITAEDQPVITYITISRRVKY